MSRRLAVAALVTALASTAAADDPNAPLAEAKQQLQSLQRDEAAQKAGTPSGVKLDLPSLNTPETNAPPTPPRREERATSEKAKARRDWLVDGFNKLERRKPSAGGIAKESDLREDETKPLDPADPDYFLRVYERQRAQSEARQLDPNGIPDTKLANSVTADPFAPFLQDWLANSPVRDALKESLPADPASDRATTADGVGPGPSARIVTNAGSPSIDASAGMHSAAGNPFIQALGLPSFDQPRSVDARPSAIDTGISSATSPVAAPNTVYDLPERAKSDLKLTLPPPPSEDKKYFPQLKKF
ncbi:MAG: hypothetical protein KF715_01020 [Candidatus Didemnitutus sp.]|nr:hypothetical protein [Candidatus Didemnitutus sp.]